MLQGILALILLAGDGQGKQKEVGAGPEPARTPIAWEFEFEYLNPPRRIEAGGDSYFYMVYKVTNKNALTQRFQPTIQLVTDDLRVIDTDLGIPSSVYEAIRQRHRLTHPHMTDPVSVIGELRSGSDNAKESVAIWRISDVPVNNFTVFVAGLSGEARLLKNPAYDSKKPERQTITAENGLQREIVVNPRHFTLRKTLELRYSVPGSVESRRSREPELIQTRWIMR